MFKRSKRVAAVACGLMLAAVGCAEGLSEPEALRVNEGGIVGGQSEAGYEAVGAVLFDGGEHCTGTLVTPTVVVTAAHCLEDVPSASSLSFFLGTDLSNRGGASTLRVENMYSHPDYGRGDQDADIAVLTLTTRAPVTPIPHTSETLGQQVVGQRALFIGYGLTGGGNNATSGEKRSVRIPITELGPKTIFYSGRGINTCNGDSGGPALLETNGSLVLVGVTSYGDEDCTEFGANTRVDVYRNFIEGIINGDPNIDPEPENPGGDDDPGDNDPGEGDFCEEEGWYGDDFCDEDCPRPDPDCEGGDFEEGDEGDFCEEEGWYGDDFCDEDCPRPDPDCEGDLDEGDFEGDEGDFDDDFDDEDLDEGDFGDDDPERGDDDGGEGFVEDADASPSAQPMACAVGGGVSPVSSKAPWAGLLLFGLFFGARRRASGGPSGSKISPRRLANHLIRRALTLPQVDEGDLRGLPASFPEDTRRLFTSYTMLPAPNGDPIHILAQGNVPTAEVMQVRLALAFHLYGDGGRPELALRMASEGAAMMLFDGFSMGGVQGRSCWAKF